jgi:hypothetical protein
MSKQLTKSPLTAAPLRVAGQSIDSQLDSVLYDEFLGPSLLALFTVVLAGLEWWRYANSAKPSPWTFTIFAVLVVVYAVWRGRSAFKQARNLRLGRDGERAVSQYLEWFRTKDFFVFHDVPTGDANIDHVLIGTRGVYVIETKTISKPVRGECRITVTENGVQANGRALDRNPITQVKAQARWLHNFLADSQFKKFVQPVVVFPGWYVERFDSKAIGAWVLEPKALDGFVENQAVVLSGDEVKALSCALSSYIRSQSSL